MPSLNVTSRIGLSDLEIPHSLSMSWIIDELKKMPLMDTVARLSSINLLIANARYREKNAVEKKLREVHLNAGLQARTIWFEGTQHSGVIFTRQSCLLLIDLARRFASSEAVTKQPHLDLNLGIFFLVANDFIAQAEDLELVENDRDANLKTVAPNLTRQFLFNHTPQVRYALPQSWLIFDGLRDQAKEHLRLDVSALIEQKRGFTLHEYYQILTILYCYWSGQTVEKWDPKHVVINPQTIFKTVSIPPERYLQVLKAMSVSVHPSDTLPDLADKVAWRGRNYEFFDLRLRPLIEINGVYICSDLDFIVSAFWDGPYHLILTDYAQTDTAKKMLDFLGDTTELYICHLGKDAFDQNFVDEDTGCGNPLGDGVIHIEENWIAVVESKAARPGIQMVSGDRPITELRDFKKLIKDGLTQLGDRIAEYRYHKGFNGRVSPILVTAGFVPQHELIWELIFKEIGTLPIFNDGQCDFPFLMDLESWNVICAAQKAGHQLQTILNLRQTDQETQTSNPHFFLYKTTFSNKEKQEPPHLGLVSLFEDRINLLTKEFFGHNVERRAGILNSWKPIFKLR